MRTSHLINFLLETRLQSRRWLYILAAVLPAWFVVEFIMSVYHVFYWSYALIVFVCFWHVFRPTVASWAVIIIFYSYQLVGVLADLASQFMDYGSEDHSAWEGWPIALSSFGIAIIIAIILAAVAWHFPKVRTHAT